MSIEEHDKDEIDRLNLNPSTITTLEHLQNLLHLFHHRNKNQHRHSIWWRHFSIFRRQLNHLLSSISSLNRVAKTHLERVRKKSRDTQTQLSIHQRLEFWRDLLIAKWWSSFSRVVGDGRFAGLGLVLLAILGEVCSLLGLSADLEKLGAEEVSNAEEVIETFEGNGGGTVSTTDLQSGVVPKGRAHEDEEDLGEVITREDEAEISRESIPSSKTRKNRPNTAKIPQKRKSTSTGDSSLAKAQTNPPRKKRE